MTLVAAVPEATSPHDRHDDLRVYSAHIVGGASGVRHLAFELGVREPGETSFHRIHKVVRLLKITRVPVAVRTPDSESMINKQRDVLAAIRGLGAHYIAMLADTAGAGHGVLQCMGIQGVGATPEEARRVADEQFAALEGQLHGTYGQIRTAALSNVEADWLLSRQSAWSQHVLAVRGIPMPRRDAGGTTTVTVAGSAATSADLEEGIEELIRGMLGASTEGFILVLLANPLRMAEITSAMRNAAVRLSRIASLVNGTRSVSAGVAIPLALTNTVGDSHGVGHTSGTSDTHTSSQTASVSDARSVTDGTTVSRSHTDTSGESTTVTGGTTAGDGTSDTRSTGTTHTVSDTVGEQQSVARGTSGATSRSHATSRTHSEGVTDTEGTNFTSTHSSSRATGSTSTRTDGWSESLSLTGNESKSTARVDHRSEGTNESDSTMNSHAFGKSASVETGVNLAVVKVGGRGGLSWTDTHGESHTDGSSKSHTTGTTDTTSQGGSVGVTLSPSVSESRGATTTSTSGTSTAHGTTHSRAVSTQDSTGVTDGVTHTRGTSTTRTDGTSRTLGEASGESTGQAATTSRSASISEGFADATTTSRSDTTGHAVSHQVGRTHTDGTTRGTSNADGVSDTDSITYARTAGVAAGFGIAPSFSVGRSFQTVDALADSLARVLASQRNRLALAQEEGAFLVQGFALCPDANTRARAASLLKSSFWGPGEREPSPQPFHTITELDAEEQQHLAAHALAFSPCRRPDRSPEAVEPYCFATALLPSELSVLTTPIRIEVPGIASSATSQMPRFRLPVHRQGPLFLGWLVDTERGVRSDMTFGLTADECLHPLVVGASGSGKSTTGLRLATEWARGVTTVQDMDEQTGLPVTEEVPHSVLCLDTKDDWRKMRGALPAGSPRWRFYSLGRRAPRGYTPPPGVPSPFFRYNLLKVPPGVTPATYRDRFADTFAVVAQLGLRGRSIVWNGVDELYKRRYFDPESNETLSVYDKPSLSRYVSISDLADWVDAQIQEMANGRRAREVGSESKERYAIIKARLLPFASGGDGADIYAGDDPTNPAAPATLDISDLVGNGDVVVLEASHIDAAAGKLVLALLFTAMFAYAAGHSGGGLRSRQLVVLEEANSYLPAASSPGSENVSGVSTSVFEDALAMGRAYNVSVMTVVQSVEMLPPQMIANAGLLVAHRTETKDGKEVLCAKIGWDLMFDDREQRKYLSRMEYGRAIVRSMPREDYLDAAPVIVDVEATKFPKPSDADLGLPAIA